MKSFAILPLLALSCVADADVPFDVEVVPAPDQPISYVYVDEPLVVEFSANRDVEVSGEIEILRAGRPLNLLYLDRTILRAGKPYWRVLENVSRERGSYALRILLTGPNNTTVEKRHSFCRIDRPLSAPPRRIAVYLPRLDKSSLAAVRAVPLSSALVDAESAHDSGGAKAIIEANLDLIVRLHQGKPGATESALTELVARFGDRVRGWDILPAAGASSIEPLVSAVRRAGSSAPIGVVAADETALQAALAADTAHTASYVVLNHPDPSRGVAGAFQAIAERAGREGLELRLHPPAPEDRPDAGARLVHDVILCAAGGSRTCVVDLPYGLDGFAPGYVALSGLVHSLGDSRYVGELDLDGVQAHVFRTDSISWVAVLWAEAGPPRTLPITLGEAKDVALKDMWNNPLLPPELKEGQIELAVGRDPRYLSGKGGGIVGRAARLAARQEAERLANPEILSAEPVAGFRDIVSTMADLDTAEPDRMNFFALLRMFPAIEAQWAGGAIPGEVAVPAMAGLSRLLRRLCTVEQENGSEFIESLNKTLGQCDVCRSQYLLAGSGDTEDNRRGAWLMGEVERLTGEARSLEAEGRMTEAGGVAALAEWRARSLAELRGPDKAGAKRN